jgi:hypothetical protein
MNCWVEGSVTSRTGVDAWILSLSLHRTDDDSWMTSTAAQLSVWVQRTTHSILEESRDSERTGESSWNWENDWAVCRRMAPIFTTKDSKNAKRNIADELSAWLPTDVKAQMKTLCTKSSGCSISICSLRKRWSVLTVIYIGTFFFLSIYWYRSLISRL